MRKVIKYGCTALLIICGLLIGGAIVVGGWYFNAVYTATETPEQTTVTFVVSEGAGLLAIADELEQAGLIRSALALRIYLRLNPTDEHILAGDYELIQGQSVPEIIGQLRDGPIIKTAVVTIPEGLRFDEHADRIETALSSKTDSFAFVKADYLAIAANPDSTIFGSEVADFLRAYKPAGASLEGFLFPDTYNIAFDATAQDVIELQITTLSDRLIAANIDGETGSLSSLHDVLTMSSIVHREGFSIEDRRLVADIFVRRLNYGWQLDADATVLYPYKRWSPAPTQLELDTITPYNTRRITGLPPTPIANPGIADILAVIDPIPNQYYYFISAGGRNYYAVTLQEHEANIREYL